MPSLQILRLHILALCLLILSGGSVHAVEVAPRISDREIIESLTELKAGQQQVNQRLDDLQVQMDKRFEAVDQRFESIDKRLDDLQTQMDKRFEAVDQRFEAMQQMMDKRFEVVDQRFESMDKRLDQQFQLTLWVGGVLVTIIVGGFGFLFAQLLRMSKKLESVVERHELEPAQLRQQEDHLRLQRLERVLYSYAEHHEDLRRILQHSEA
jgi:exonuclease VII large subunit